jgi:hypothetical protein
LGREFFNNEVIDEHPFGWIKQAQLETNSKMVLAGWQEISKEEYKSYLDDEITEDSNQIIAHDADFLKLLNGDPSEGLKS